MKLLIIQFSPASSYFLYLRSKYSQQCVLNNPQCFTVKLHVKLLTPSAQVLNSHI